MKISLINNYVLIIFKDTNIYETAHINNPDGYIMTKSVSQTWKSTVK